MGFSTSNLCVAWELITPTQDISRVPPSPLSSLRNLSTHAHTLTHTLTHTLDTHSLTHSRTHSHTHTHTHTHWTHTHSLTHTLDIHTHTHSLSPSLSLSLSHTHTPLQCTVACVSVCLAVEVVLGVSVRLA